MSTTGLRSFDHSLQTTKDWLKDLKAELGTDDEQKAYVTLRAVLHALRDRLTVEEASDLAAQIPMLLQGVYYHAWNPSKNPEKYRTKEEFLAKIEQELAAQDVDAETAAKAVFSMLQKRVPGGEIDDVKGDLPQHIREFWPEG